MESYLCIFVVVFTCVLPGVMGDDTIDDIGGMVAAAVVGFFLLITVFVIIGLGLTWDSWYPKVQMWRGRVKIPRHIIKLRKKRAEKAKSTASTVMFAENGQIPAVEPDTKSWVEGWKGAPPIHREYETKDVTMTLGEELPDDDNFRIEAELVDNEQLDLGPYKKMSDHTVVESSGADDVQSPIYSSVIRTSQQYNGATTNHAHEETATSFSAMAADPAVVIL